MCCLVSTTGSLPSTRLCATTWTLAPPWRRWESWSARATATSPAGRVPSWGPTACWWKVSLCISPTCWRWARFYCFYRPVNVYGQDSRDSLNLMWRKSTLTPTSAALLTTAHTVAALGRPPCSITDETFYFLLVAWVLFLISWLVHLISCLTRVSCRLDIWCHWRIGVHRLPSGRTKSEHWRKLVLTRSYKQTSHKSR